MNRHDLTNSQWERFQPLLPPQKPHTGRPAADHRRILNGILWIIRTGAPWRDLPDRYPPHGTCHDRLTRWQRAGIWERVLQALLAEADAAGELAWVRAAVDSTTVRAHQHAAGARRAPGKKGELCRLLARRSGAAGAG